MWAALCEETDGFARVLQMRVAFGQQELGDEWTVDQDKRHAPGWFADP